MNFLSSLLPRLSYIVSSVYSGETAGQSVIFELEETPFIVFILNWNQHFGVSNTSSGANVGGLFGLFEIGDTYVLNERFAGARYYNGACTAQRTTETQFAITPVNYSGGLVTGTAKILSIYK